MAIVLALLILICAAKARICFEAFARLCTRL